uniref:Uncharacterized protein n=3 Tax=Avena sativa TaxID=4498 RepID=A0ACD5U9T3_AVESA
MARPNCPSGHTYKTCLTTSHDSAPRVISSPLSIVLLVMAVQVQAQHVSRAFHHDLHSYRALEDRATGASLFSDELGGCAPAMAGTGTTMLNDVPRSDLTCNDNNYNSASVPRKRARVAAAAASDFMDERPRGVRAPAVAGLGNTLFGDMDLTWNDNTCSHGFVQRNLARVVAEAPSFLENPQAQGSLPVGDVLTRAVGSGAASTSGRMPNAASPSQNLLSHLYHQGMEIGAVVRVETERMRAGLELARRRHVRALVSAAERAAAGRLQAAEAALELARCRNATLAERLGQISAEGQAWIGVAKSHEAVVAGLRATLEQLLQSPCAAVAQGPDGAGDAEDARSCCFETPADDGEAASNKSRVPCKACVDGESCVLLLPCRHLCLCPACDATVDACPVCAGSKNASLHVLLS